MEKEIVPHRKSFRRKKPKKSDHKHDYEVVAIAGNLESEWFTHKEVCKICGKENNRLVMEDESNLK